jgi:electron transfer flavoprotein beta subunit
MNIYVLVKQVPDTSEMKVDKETGTLIRDGVQTIINPDDLAAVEEALRIKETLGAKVTTITMGPAKAEDMLRELYGYGVDEAVLLCDRKFAGSDTLATSTIIANYLQDKDFDLIIAGRQAIDGDTAQVGPQIAELLDIEQITYVKEIVQAKHQYITLEKESETSIQTLKAPYPLLITMLSDQVKPRYMNVENLVKGFHKNIQRISFEELSLDQNAIGLKGSPTKVKKTFTKVVAQKTEPKRYSKEAAVDAIIQALSPHL